MIYNKSSHPVEVKKISVRIWSLRDEIEAAIGRRMKECEAAGVPLYIDDLKRFYNLDPDSTLSQDNVLQLKPKGDEDAMTSLMESLAEETPEEKPAEDQDSQTLSKADEIIAEQKLQGMEAEKPNPIIDRPYQRLAPDLDKISYGFTFLSDVNMDNILSFTKDKFLQGQSVVVEFLIPQPFMMTANVAYCHHYALRSRIISTTKPDYRLQCRFTYSIPGERDTLRNFLKSIEPTIPQGKKGNKKSEEDSLGI